jgi:hypothetical protein
LRLGGLVDDSRLDVGAGKAGEHRIVERLVDGPRGNYQSLTGQLLNTQTGALCKAMIATEPADISRSPAGVQSLCAPLGPVARQVRKNQVDLVRCERCYLKSSEVVEVPVLSLQAVRCVYGSVITCQRAMVFVRFEYPHDGIALCVAAVEMALIMIECISFRAEDTG